MILYYTGTGNSAYIANCIANSISDDTLDLFNKLKNHDYSTLTSEKPWIIVVPTYAWQIPHIVRDWMKKTRLQGNREIYFIMTCGDSIGAAPAHLRKLCKAKNLHYKGCAKIVMPENYIALFDAPDLETSKKIIKRAERDLRIALKSISTRTFIPEKKPGIKDRLLSGPVNTIFYRFIVMSKKFYTKDSCITCGQCEKVCPMDNISIYNGKPIWGDDCTHCMACICKCPKEAIEYGKASRGKVRYTCPL